MRSKTPPAVNRIASQGSKAVAQVLGKTLADTYALYLKTQFFHWNVKGPDFEALHAAFNRQYEELAEAVDEIAERIRALGFAAPGSFSEFARLTSVPEEKDVPSAPRMVRSLLEGHETVARVLQEGIETAEQQNDPGTADLLTQRLQSHEKTAWMLRSTLS